MKLVCDCGNNTFSATKRITQFVTVDENRTVIEKRGETIEDLLHVECSECGEPLGNFNDEFRR